MHPYQIEIIGILKRCEVFIGLGDDKLASIAELPSNKISQYLEGQVISAAGDKAEYIYILIDGKIMLNLLVQFEDGIQPQEITVDTVHKGSVFGWSALVQPYAFSRTSLCAEKSKVLAIKGAELIGLMDHDEKMGYEIMRSIASVIASRLRTPNNYFWAELLKARNKSAEQ